MFNDVSKSSTTNSRSPPDPQRPLVVVYSFRTNQLERNRMKKKRGKRRSQRGETSALKLKRVDAETKKTKNTHISGSSSSSSPPSWIVSLLLPPSLRLLLPYDLDDPLFDDELSLSPLLLELEPELLLLPSSPLLLDELLPDPSFLELELLELFPSLSLSLSRSRSLSLSLSLALPLSLSPLGDRLLLLSLPLPLLRLEERRSKSSRLSRSEERGSE